MEGNLEQRTWSGKWKLRYVRVKDQMLSIFASEKDTVPKFESSILGCSVKKLSKERYNKLSAFKVEINSQRLEFAAENDQIRADWTSFLANKGRRTSFVATEVRRTSLLSKTKRDSILLADKNSLLENITLESSRIVSSIDKITDTPSRDTAMDDFIHVAHDFLTVVRKIASGGECPSGITTTEVKSADVRKIQAQMISLAYIFSLHVQGVYVPLQALVRMQNGKLIFISTDHIMRRSGLSEHSRAKLQHLAMQAGEPGAEAKIEAVEDKKSKLWVINASVLISNLGERAKTAAEALSAQLAWDSDAVADVLASHFIALPDLEATFDQSPSDFTRGIIEAEMVASICASELSTFEPDLSQDERAVAFFNAAMDPESALMQRVTAECATQFHPITDTSKSAIFGALQRNSGAEFEDVNGMPLTCNDLVATHPAIFHTFRVMCVPPSPRSLLEEVVNGRYRAAIELLSAQAEVHQKLNGSIGAPLARSMALLSVMYSLAGDFTLASECSDATQIASVKNSIWTELCSADAYDRLRVRLGDEHPAVGFALMVGAALCNNQERFDEAKELALKACQAGVDSLIRAGSLGQLALACAHRGDKAECIEALQKIEFETPFSQLSRAFLLFNDGDYKGAIEIATKIYDELSGAQLDRVGYNVVELIGNCFDMMHDYPTARLMYRLMADAIAEVDSTAKEEALASVGRNIARTMLKEMADKDPEGLSRARTTARAAMPSEVRAALLQLAAGAAGEEAAFAGI